MAGNYVSLYFVNGNPSGGSISVSGSGDGTTITTATLIVNSDSVQVGKNLCYITPNVGFIFSHVVAEGDIGSITLTPGQSKTLDSVSDFDNVTVTIYFEPNKYTTNYNLKKPATTDYVTIGDINDNMDKIDAQMHSNALAIAKKIDIKDLATVATSGSYNDLANKPTIPTVNNATLTIQKNGNKVATFTANSSSNVTANITVPTVDTSLSSTSTNAISNKAVYDAIKGSPTLTTLWTGSIATTGGTTMTLTDSILNYDIIYIKMVHSSSYIAYATILPTQLSTSYTGGRLLTQSGDSREAFVKLSSSSDKTKLTGYAYAVALTAVIGVKWR